MNRYNGYELAQGVDITKNGVTMSADEIVNELERLEQALEESRKGDPVGEVAYIAHIDWATNTRKGVALVDKSLPPGTPVFAQPGAAMAHKWRVTADHHKTIERRLKIEDLSRHNHVIHRVLSMARREKKPWTECMEVAVIALAETEQHLRKVAADCLGSKPAALYITDTNGYQAVEAEKARTKEITDKMADDLIRLKDLIRRIHDELHYGEIYQWDNGSQVWRDMEAEAERIEQRDSKHSERSGGVNE